MLYKVTTSDIVIKAEMALIHFPTIAVLIHSERVACQENNIFLSFTPEVKTLP